VAVETDTSHPTISPRPWLVMSGAFGACYLALPWLMFGGATVSIWLLVGFAVAGAGIGALTGVMESKRSGKRFSSRRSSRSTGAFIVGTTGSALLLGRFLDESAVPWVVLGCTALATGAAAHARLAPKRSDAP
jgi:predicted MFS family arabinose efflux permease